MTTDTILEDDRWQALGLDGLAQRSVLAVLSHLGHAPQAYDVAVLGCDDDRIAVLNGDFRDKPQPTNVLSWPEEDLSADRDGDAPLPPEQGDPDDPHPLGDIAIAYETCQQEAAHQGKQIDAHVTHLLVHGVLHLLGYDHIRDADATVMEGLEVEILGKLGISDPYTTD